ncbi:HIT family protein [Paenibacillus medicaginis]|uniref:HIT family protein n=1 Tax=Paenibacillus medicaginis TaxID=1470560 RepID=A0ABV5C854_9BACL
MQKDCIFCNSELEPRDNEILSNEHCRFLQLEEAREKGSILEGAGVIVPKHHRETAFDLTPEEWEATYTLLQQAKAHIDKLYQPDGYNIGWNCGETAGQHIMHAHLHVLPRYNDEPMAGKGIRYVFKSALNERRK